MNASGRSGPFAALVLSVAVSLCGNTASAQYGSGAHSGRESEALRLVVRPRVGDTLWLQLEQTVETRTVPVAEPLSTPPTGAAAPGGTRVPSARLPDYGPMRDQPFTQTVVMRMFAHSLVEASTLDVTSLVATTDSLHAKTGQGSHFTPFRSMALPAGERVVRVKVTPEGAMSVVDPSVGTATLDASFVGMPPMLPPRSVSVGDQWEREIPLPSLSMSGVHAEGVVHAQFRLDSVSRGARLAYVSMSGTLHREGAARDLPPGTQVATSGTLRGSLVLDRTRGWITEAETIIQVQSDMTPRSGDKAPGRSMDIRLSQHMKVR